MAGPDTGGFSGDGAPAAGAKLSDAIDIAVDAQGSIYFADSGNNRVRMVGRDGRIHNFAGDGQQGLPGSDGDHGNAISAHLHYPRAIAIDAHDNVYIADFFNDRVRMVSAATANISTFAGTGVRG